MEGHRVQVALFVTCLIDVFRPSAGFAAVKLLEEAGCSVAVPHSQTCCGQPAYNSGDRETAKEIAKRVIAAFETFPCVIVPSGSCAGMLSKHYPQLFDTETEPSWHARATGFASRVRELNGVPRRRSWRGLHRTGFSAPRDLSQFLLIDP